MKKLLLLFTSCFLSCTSNKELILPEKLDSIYIQKATHFAKSQFESCVTKKYIPITKEIATLYLVKNLTVEVTKETCAEINEKYGDLLHLNLVQTLFYKNQFVYRFKAQYSKTTEPCEIRVYSNLSHQFSGLIFKRLWTDKYREFNPSK